MKIEFCINKYLLALRQLVLLAAMLTNLQVLAADPSPRDVVSATIEEVIADMDRNAALYENDSGALDSMVRTRVLPHFDVTRMVRMAMAANWAKATGEQRDTLVREFTDMMIRSYTNAMFVYRHEKLTVLGDQVKGTQATVKMRVDRSTGAPVDLMLRLLNTDGRWQVIDLVAGGVSMLITFRSNFADQISKTGIDGLIENLRGENLQKSASQ